MGLILSDKWSNEPASFVEQTVNRLRFSLREMRENGETEYREGDREHNAKCMRKLWKLVQTGEVLADYSQRAFFALCVGKIPTRAIAVNAKGEQFVANISLDTTRSFQYRQSASSLVPYKRQIATKRNRTVEENEYELLRLKEFCEYTLQKRANSAVVQLHSVKLMVAWHRDGGGKSVDRVRCVNIDNTYNTFDKERPNYRRRHLALPASRLDLATMQARAAAFCDSARLVGEQAVLQDSYAAKPRQNIALAVMSEASMVVSYCYDVLDIFTRGVLKEASKYKGFSKADKVLQKDAVTMRYADGVTLYSGRHATSVYNHEQLKYDAVRRLVAAGAMTVDVPRFSFFATYVENGVSPRCSNGKLVWETGREFVRKNLDLPVQRILRAYSRK